MAKPVEGPLEYGWLMLTGCHRHRGHTKFLIWDLHGNMSAAETWVAGASRGVCRQAWALLLDIFVWPLASLINTRWGSLNSGHAFAT